jgi:hypothetical protein
MYESICGGASWGTVRWRAVRHGGRWSRHRSGRPSTIFDASDGAGVYLSQDAGATWAPASHGLTVAFALSVAVDPSDPSTVSAETRATAR